MRGKRSWNIRLLVISSSIALAVLLAISWVGNSVVQRYRSNMSINSANLLGEYGQQVVSTIGMRLNNNWKITGSVTDALELRAPHTVDTLLHTLQRLRERWDLADIILYTARGDSINCEGIARNIDAASEIVYQIRTAGRYMNVYDTKLYFSVPVQSTLTVAGERVVGVSVVVDELNIINDLKISSFDHSATIYLTQENGLIVSRSSNAIQSAINIETVIDNGTLAPLSGDVRTMRDALKSPRPAFFTYTDDKNIEQYVVTLPLQQNNLTWKVAFAAPITVVDASMNAFSAFLTRVYLMLVIAAALLMTTICVIYMRQRLKSINAVLVRERMLNLVVTNTSNVFYLIDPERRKTVFVSENEYARLGGNLQFSVRQISGALCVASADGVDPDFVDALNTVLAQHPRGVPVEESLPIIVSGEKRFLKINFYPIADQETEYIAVMNDVTKEQEREQALRDALAAADEANQAKSRFLSNMSHDIRTPMNAIINMTAFALQSEDEPEKVHEYLQTIHASSAHLIELINDVLDMSRIESGKTRVEREAFSLRARLEQVEAIIAPLCEAREQRLCCAYAIRHDHLLGDQLKLNQILINLLNNAVKFTPTRGQITFSVDELTTLTGEQTAFRFVVRDNGAGIAPEEHASIFEPFVRASNTSAHKEEGSGLGLSISKRFVEVMGGKIMVESALNAGAVFTVELPFEYGNTAAEQIPPAREKPVESVSFAGMHVLLCEDNIINRQIAVMMLESIGFSVTVADDGQQGYETFAASAEGAFDMIFMDIQMPVMTGYEATRAIRAAQHPDAATIPIIAMTANVFKEDVECARAAGMDAHIGKPLELEAIVGAVQGALRARKGASL